MILDISDYCTAEGKEEFREVSIDMESFQTRSGSFPVRKKKPFGLHFSNPGDKRLFVKGETDVTISIPCDRCLSEVEVSFHLAVDRELFIGEDGLREGESPEQPDYIQGFRLDVDRLLGAEILVAWPMKVLCSDDCKGICPKCGANRNVTDCGCDLAAPDPRMAAFQDVFNKFKEV